MMRCFSYDDEATGYLASRDARLAKVIERVATSSARWTATSSGRPCVASWSTDIIQGAGHHLGAAQRAYGGVASGTIVITSMGELQALGMTFRKADYIADIARCVVKGFLDLNVVTQMGDDMAIEALCTLKGVGTVRSAP